MPDRPHHTEFQVLKIVIAPAKREQFPAPKSSRRIEKSERALSYGQLAEKKLQLRQFNNFRAFFLASRPDERA